MDEKCDTISQARHGTSTVRKLLKNGLEEPSGERLEKNHMIIVKIGYN